MKKQLFLILAILTVGITQAQPTQGNLLVGGSGYVRNLFQSGPDLTEIRLSPNVGYMLTNRFALGINLGFDQSSFRSNASNRTITIMPGGGTSVFERQNITVLRAGIFARGYLNDKRLCPFLQGGLGYFRHTNTEKLEGFPEYRRSFSNINLSGSVGLSYFFTRQVAVEGMLTGNYGSGFVPGPGYNDLKSLVGFNIGFQIFLPVRKSPEQ